MEFEKVLDCLNSAFKADPSALHALIMNRVPCNEELADHPSIVVQTNPVVPMSYFIGVIGLLNGVMDSLGLPRVAAEFSDEIDGRRFLLGFTEYQVPEDQGP